MRIFVKKVCYYYAAFFCKTRLVLTYKFLQRSFENASFLNVFLRRSSKDVFQRTFENVHSLVGKIFQRNFLRSFENVAADRNFTVQSVCFVQHATQLNWHFSSVEYF